MRKALFALVVSVGLLAAWPGAAAAAPTRAEYIAQVDPICQSFVAPLGSAWRAYNKNFRDTSRAARKGNSKAFLRGTKKLARSLNLISTTRTTLIGQIAAVPPPDADAGTITTWLNDLRQEAGIEIAAASKVKRLQFGKFFKLLRQADGVETAGKEAIAGFGFAVCGVFPIV
jgi:hypothetical protein